MEELSFTRVFTTSQLAQKLGIGPSMARRYGLAFEAVSGQPLPQAPGKGRMYPDHVASVLEEARERLLSHPEETVESALRVVLNLEEPEPQKEPQTNQSIEIRLTTQQLRQELEQALKPVLAEIQALKEENYETRREIQALRALPAPQELSELQREHENLFKRHQLLQQALEKKEQELKSLKARAWWQFWRIKS
jgi:small-conductance mechanosensitive channel